MDFHEIANCLQATKRPGAGNDRAANRAIGWAFVLLNSNITWGDPVYADSAGQCMVS